MKGKVEIVNVKRVGKIGEYIGRPSVLGNPFAIGRDGSRSEVIAKYAVWLERQLKTNKAVREKIVELVKRYRRGETIILACWCAPLACHGEIIKSKIEQLT